MKENLFFKCLIVILIICQIPSCQKEKVNPDLTGEVVNNSDCKTFKSASLTADVPDNQSCVAWTYDHSSDKLSLKHINAGFNCCPG